MNLPRSQQAGEGPGKGVGVKSNELVSGLRQLGLEAGDLVLIHSSLNDLDRIEGGPDSVIDAFLDVVGPKGTVAMHTGRRIVGWPRTLFNRATSPSEMGLISNAFWRRPGAKRSGDPAGSVAAIGPLAEELTRTHDGDERRDSPWSDRTFGQESPWQRLYDRDAKVVLLADEWRGSRLFRFAGVLYMESLRGKYKPDVPFPSFDHGIIGRRLEEEGLVQAVFAGPLTIRAVSVPQAVDRALELFREDPLAYFPEGHADRFGFAAWHRRIPLMERRLEAGLGKACITPDVPYGHRGVVRDVWARAIVVRDGDSAIGLILVEQLFIDEGMTEQVRGEVERLFGLPGDRLMIACTHAHRVPYAFGRRAVPAYVPTVASGMVEAVRHAMSNVQAVRVGAAKVKTEGIAVNRRIKMIDGSVFTSRYRQPSTWYISPRFVQGVGPTDPWLTTLRIEDLNGKVAGIVGNFTGHPLVAFPSKYISGDCFGHAADLLESIHPGSVAMLTNGAEGNVKAAGPFPESGPRYDRQAERVGQLIGGYWLAALAQAPVVDGGSVTAKRREITLPLRPLFVEWVKASSPEVRDFYAELVERGTIVTEVQALRINDAVLVGVPGECFVEVQLMIKEKSKFPSTIVVGLANGLAAYVPTRQAFSEGGYEVADSPELKPVNEDALGDVGMAALSLVEALWNEYSTRG